MVTSNDCLVREIIFINIIHVNIQIDIRDYISGKGYLISANNWQNTIGFKYIEKSGFLP